MSTRSSKRLELKAADRETKEEKVEKNEKKEKEIKKEKCETPAKSRKSSARENEQPKDKPSTSKDVASSSKLPRDIKLPATTSHHGTRSRSLITANTPEPSRPTRSCEPLKETRDAKKAVTPRKVSRERQVEVKVEPVEESKEETAAEPAKVVKKRGSKETEETEKKAEKRESDIQNVDTQLKKVKLGGETQRASADTTTHDEVIEKAPAQKKEKKDKESATDKDQLILEEPTTPPRRLRPLRVVAKPVKEPTSDSEEHDSDYEANLATLPELQKLENPEGYEEKDELIWAPCAKMETSIKKRCLIKDYIKESASLGMSTDRALNILMKNDYYVCDAQVDIHERELIRDNWAQDDKDFFRRVFAAYGKNFDKIGKAMPHKTRAQLVNYYYLVKNTEKFKTEARDLENDELEESEDDDLDYRYGHCENCGEEKRLTQSDNQYICNVCRQYMRIMEEERPYRCHVPYVAEEDKEFDDDPSLPHGMEDVVHDFATLMNRIDDDDFEALKREEEERIARRAEEIREQALKNPRKDDDIEVVGDNGKLASIPRRFNRPNASIPLQFEADMYRKEAEVEVLIKSCKKMEKEIDWQSEKMKSNTAIIDKYKYLSKKEPKERQRYSHNWTKGERYTAFYCLVRYKRDFAIAAEIVGTKSADMIKAYYQKIQAKVDKLVEEEIAKEREQVANTNVSDMLDLGMPDF